MVVDASCADSGWRVAYADDACQQLLGSEGPVAGEPFWSMVEVRLRLGKAWEFNRGDGRDGTCKRMAFWGWLVGSHTARQSHH